MTAAQNQADPKNIAGDLPASGEEIIKGARNVDQLDKMREAANGARSDQSDLNESDPEGGYRPTNATATDETQTGD